MDARGFYEVFPEVKIDNDLSRILNETVVTRVSRDKILENGINIYLTFNTLIPKRRIWALEDSIKKQLFAHNNVTILIKEDFKLSSQYNLRYIYDEYKDSILEEIDRHSSLLLNIYKKADVSFLDDEHMLVTLEDTVIAHEKAQEIHDILFTIFNKRCHQNVIFDFDYKEPKKSKYLENSIKEIEGKVADIERRQRQIAVVDSVEGADKKIPVSENKVEFKKNKDSEKDTVKPRTRQMVRSDNPDVIYGKDFDDATMPIEEIVADIGQVTIRGQICSIELKPIKNEKTIFMATITDFTDTIGFKMFFNNDELSQFTDNIHEGDFVKIKGNTNLDKFDHELTISSIWGIMKIPSFLTTRSDNSLEKRVELHCHTKMSEFDGVSEVSDIIKRAKKWGHKAIAITDHGVVQAFPEANHCVSPSEDFKVIYGCEIYLVDDTKTIVTDEMGQRLDGMFVVFDIETTGFNQSKDRIIEIGAVKIINGEIVDRFSEFINPQRPIPYRITELTSIRDDMVESAPTIEEILPKFKNFAEGCVLVAHNADFDTGFIKANCERLCIDWNFTFVDTVGISRFLIPSLGKHKLDNVAKAVGVSLEHHHRAVDDAECTAHIFEKFITMLHDRGIDTLSELNERGKLTPESLKKMHPYHCIVLAKNDLGRVNLYRLVSESHISYFGGGKPHVPKSLVEECRDGLIIGSACEAGELFRALVENKNGAEIDRLVNFYDYLEIQPIGNNAFMKLSDRYEDINTDEDLRELNKRIVALGEEYHKPVVATCDVHFLDPDDEIYRRIIMANKGFDDADNQAPLFLHSTEEMLEEFSYLGLDKAHEVVIENTNLIADMCERIEPVRPDKSPPVIEKSDETLRKICYDKAHAMYGPDLPTQVSERLERELNSIISNGYAVMYIIAQKLVWKSNEDGYLVGSRGSVGSSFVATMAGITEVNPLSAHYLCPECYWVDFDSEEVKSFSGRGGCDMPDKKCPCCGAELTKQGFDIPFETFLGFYGDKEPDIDLNFSGDYQSKAHRYTEVIFGEGQTYKAGTVSTVADNTAYGYVKKYFEKREITKRNSEVQRLLKGCTGVKSTTGQHPGGIIVLPVGEDIYSFTPIQHPANKDTDIVTTHFDYHSIDMNLLKLDILGHDDPTMIRSLQDLIGIDPTEIPLDDPGVMSLFKDTSALKVQPKDLMDTPLGTLGIPEFGTDFAMQMLIDAKPTEFTDLVRIAGLAHGTDVWLGNAQDLIKSGQCTISTAICCRDDIMVYLIAQGVEAGEAFKIMEDVRKGKVAKGKCDKWDKYKEDMRACGVPEWYIGSCEKIKYMFPKAHAVAYVMMAWRVAYCKVYYPLEFYASFFSIRAKCFDYEMMCQGQATCERYIKEYKSKADTSATDDNTLRDLRIVQEMYARGFEFLPMDLYNSDARYFKIVDGKLLPPFNVISGMGDKAAEQLSIAAAESRFLSLDDIKERGKVSQTILDKMVELGIVKDLPKSNQLSLFDFA